MRIQHLGIQILQATQTVITLVNDLSQLRKDSSSSPWSRIPFSMRAFDWISLSCIYIYIQIQMTQIQMIQIQIHISLYMDIYFILQCGEIIWDKAKWGIIPLFLFLIFWISPIYIHSLFLLVFLKVKKKRACSHLLKLNVGFQTNL